MTRDELVEIEAIKRLKYAYSRCLDTKAWDELATLVTPDVVDHRRPQRSGRLTPRNLS